MRLLATLAIFLSLVACSAPTPQVIVITATPEPATPTAVPQEPPTLVPTQVSTQIPTPFPQSVPVPTKTGITAAGITLPPAIPTLRPSVPVATPTLAPELTGAVDALVACLGGDREYWLSKGPPPLTDALVECLNKQLGGQ